MEENLTRSKLYSGRFILCICTAFTMVLFTVALAFILWDTRHEGDINPAIMAGVSLMSNLMIAVVTFYFTKSSNGRQ